MEIYVSGYTIKDAIEQMGDDAALLNYGSFTASARDLKRKIKVYLDELSLEQLIAFHLVMKANDEEDEKKVKKLSNALGDVENKLVTSLKEFPQFLKTYLERCDNPLLHSLVVDQRGVAYLPIAVTYTEHTYRHQGEPHVTFELAYSTKKNYKTLNITLTKRDVYRRSVPSILRERNLMVPDESMNEEYRKIKARYDEFVQMQGEQFWCRGEASLVGQDYWWSARTQNLSHGDKPTKVVVDVENVSKDRYSNVSRVMAQSEIYGQNKLIPVHPVIPVFSLAHHVSVWVNVVNMKKYKYEVGLRDKLVLPKSHVRLIGALVSNLEVMRQEDEAEDRSRTIQAKARSSIILAKGPAGTGKTLTAEVYAEEKRRPLYEVQSGQIGVEPEEIENNLTAILNRSIRLNMPLLINEADVFIQKRGSDMHQNAVVSVFLRLLEYHEGLVFLTSNRSEDIDDAILSRCIAEIQYGTPAPTEKLRLWQIMLKEFNVELPKTELNRAVLMFPTVVGRDIQNLIRLTNRVCTATGEKFSLQALSDNAVFKSIEQLDAAKLEIEIQARIQARKDKEA